MAIVVADLVAKVRAEGVQETATAVKAVGDQAAIAARALENMAAAYAKQMGGTPGQALEMFQRSGAVPNAAAMAQAAAEMQKTAAAAAAAVVPAQAVAKAAADHATAAATGARAAQQVSDGWKLSESSIVRFGTALIGVNLGISLVAGAARLVHDAIEGIVTSQLDWERSLKTLSGLYGTVGGQAAALATAQANLPGVAGSAQEFAQARINASALTLRYGVPQRAVDQFITTGGRVSYALGLDPAAQQALQAQILAAVQTGAPLPPQYGVYTDPEAVARRLGTPGAQTLQAYTPSEVMQARAAIVSGDLNAFADRANTNQRAALQLATDAQKAADQARTNVTLGLETMGQGGGVAGQSELARMSGYNAILGAAGERQQARDLAARAAIGSGAEQGNAEASLRELVTTQSAYAQALAQSTTAQEESRRTFETLRNSVDAAGARLLGFFGSLETTTSIGHGDILAQAQGAVAARARSAIPLFGMGAAEIGALALGDTWQAAWQNFVAEQAQGPQANAIQRNLQSQADTSGFARMSPDRQDARISAASGAQRALDQAALTGPVYQAQREAQSRAALVDLQTADTQARLEAITLTQRERSLAMLRETVDLRRLDVQQQQIGLVTTQNVIRAQQEALPVQRTVAAAQFQQDMAQALSRQRMARLLIGGDVSNLPTVNQLIQQNFGGQLASAEAGPEAVTRAYAITQAQQPATAADLAQALTATQIRTEELKVDLANLSDLPQQTAIGTDLLQNNRDQLSVQTELRELLKRLVSIQSNQPLLPVPSDAADRRAPSAPSDLAGARHQ